jgi:hypothetical protein
VADKPANKVATRATMVGGKRARVIDVHAHVAVAETLDIVKGTRAEEVVLHQLTSRDSIFLDDRRLEDMDANGIDVAAVSINSFWDRMDKSTVTRLLDVQNACLAELAGALPWRFQAFASMAIQCPDVAVKQLEHAIKELGLCGVAIGASIADDELADRKFDPFWAKIEELQTLVLTPENIGHLAAVCGADRLVIGADYPTPPRVDEAIDPGMETPGLSDAECIAILGGPAARWPACSSSTTDWAPYLLR